MKSPLPVTIVAAMLFVGACGDLRSDVGRPTPTITTPSATASPLESPSPTVVGDAAAIPPCAGLYPGLHLVGAFVSNAGEVAAWVEDVAYPDAPHVTRSAFRAYPLSAPIYLCYFSGLWNPPLGATGATNLVGSTGPTPTPDTTVFDRALYFVDSTGVLVEPSKIAPSALLPVQRPGGRF